MYEIICAVILGVVEGLTEFLPVSSTAHLVLVGELLRFSGPGAETFEVFIQLGAILAVVILYFERFLALLPSRAAAPVGEHSAMRGWPGLVKIGATCVPAFVLGFLFRKQIKEVLFHPFPIAIALIAGGVVMIVIERMQREPRVRDLDQISLGDCVKVGLFQCLALWPGMSRSGSTIIGGMLIGLERRVAAELSFLVAVPVMFAAVGYDLLKSIDHLALSDAPYFAVGFLVAFVTALAAIKGFLKFISVSSFAPFGWWRIAVGVATLWALR